MKQREPDFKAQALIVIDVQKGFHDSAYWGKRNNPHLEERITTLLAEFREARRPVLHVQHRSVDPRSPLQPHLPGVEFMDFAKPQGEEIVFHKNVDSAFIGTELNSFLRERKWSDLVFAGLTSDHCVSTTVRMAANFGFRPLVISDATATFERRGAGGVTFDAQLVHEVSLASLNGEFAIVRSTTEFLEGAFGRTAQAPHRS